MTPGDAPIPLARGIPSLDIVDVEGLRAAADRALAGDPAGVTAYGPPAGYAPLREWIADRHGVETEQVVVTNGSIQAGGFLFDLLVREGDAVIVEQPTYDRTLLSLRGRGAEVRAVELESDGIDVAALEALLDQGVAPRLVHLLPNFHNPAGHTLSAGKREWLVRLAGQHGFTIFEDDPYVELRFGGEPPPTMLSLDAGERVVYASSFSKTICPGVRVGYLIAPDPLVARIAALAMSAYIAPNMLAQAVVNEFCRSGALDRSVDMARRVLAERAATLCGALGQAIPEARFAEPQGGYYLWVELPEGTDGDAFYDAALQRGVQIVKGADFLVDGGGSAFRIAYSGVTRAQIEEGVRRLADAFRSLGAAA